MNMLAAIARRRAALVVQAAAQRDEIGRIIEPWQKPLALVDRGIEIVQRLRTNPLAIAAGVVFFVWMRRRRFGRWTGPIWAAWQLYSSLRSPRQKNRV
jgi:hypothetical protein